MKTIVALIALIVLVSGCVSGETALKEIETKQVQKTAEKTSTPAQKLPTATQTKKETPQETKEPANTPAPEIAAEDADQRNCLSSEGVWILFSDTCMDTCIKARSPQPVAWCENREVYGCDCGSGRCWNGSICESD